MTSNFSSLSSLLGLSSSNAALSVQSKCAMNLDIDSNGVTVPLEHISYDNDFEVSRCHSRFTAKVSGYYFISYHVRTSGEASVTTGIHKNGSAIETLTDQTPHEKVHSGESIVFLKVGDYLQLVISGCCDCDIRLLDHTGASLNVIKIA